MDTKHAATHTQVKTPSKTSVSDATADNASSASRSASGDSGDSGDSAPEAVDTYAAQKEAGLVSAKTLRAPALPLDDAEVVREDDERHNEQQANAKVGEEK